MLIRQVEVRNFRSIKHEILCCEPYTVLVGRNGAGKSSFLRALRLFMTPAESPTEEDYYNRNTQNEILITVTFDNLLDDERAEYQSNLNGEGALVVARRFPGGYYLGYTSGCKAFELIRDMIRAKEKVSVQAEKLKELVASGHFPGLQAVSRKIEDELTRWEQDNPERCERYMRSGIFDGPPNIAGGKLGHKTHFVYVPAVQEASEEAGGARKSQYFSELVAPVVELITSSDQVNAAFEAAEERYEVYRGLVRESPTKSELESQVTAILRRYVQDTEATLELQVDEIAQPRVLGQMLLSEAGFSAPVSHTGHGLQRAYILSVVELYQRFQAAGSGQDIAGTDIVFAIEEPELYQHPTRLRSIHRTFRQLTKRDATSDIRFQIICTTHCPSFVAFDMFDSLRRVTKDAPEEVGEPGITRVFSTSLRDVGAKYLSALGDQTTEPTDRSTAARLQAIMGPHINEGFFSEAVVLVEGTEDAAVLEASAQYMRRDLDALGISVLPVGGKTNLLYPACVFSLLQMRVFTVFDGDAGKEDSHPGLNKGLLSFMGEVPEEQPATRVYTSGACWETDLISECKKAVGQDLWCDAFTAACQHFSMPADQSQKKYAVVFRTVQKLLEQGAHLPLVRELIENAVRVAQDSGTPAT